MPVVPHPRVFAFFAVLAIIMTDQATTQPLPFEADLPIASLAREVIPPKADSKALIGAGEEVLLSQGGRWPSGTIDFLLLRGLAAAAISLETVHVRDKNVDAGAAAVEAWYHLSTFAHRSWAVVALTELGTPPHERAPLQQRDALKAYVDTVGVLDGLARKRMKALMSGDVGKTPRALRFQLRFHVDRLEQAPAKRVFERLAKRAKSPDDELLALGLRSLALPKADAERALRSFGDRHPEQRRSAARALARVVDHAALLAAREAVRTSDSPAARVAQLLAEARFWGWQHPKVWQALREAEKAFPDNGDLAWLRVPYLILNSLVADAITYADEIAPKVTVTLPETRRWRLATAVMSLMLRLSNGKLEKLAQLLDRIESDRRTVTGTEPFVLDMISAYVAVAKTLEDAKVRAAYDELKKAGSGSGAAKTLIKGARTAIEPLLKKYQTHVDVWRLRLLADVTLDLEKLRSGLDAWLARMDNSVGPDQRNAADLFASLVLIVAGRQQGAAARLDQALVRLERVKGRLEAHRKKILADPSLMTDVCPKTGCVSVGVVYSWLGAARNLRRGTFAPDRLGAWDKRTVQLMRQGERRMREYDAQALPEHAQIMSHRCFALVMSGAVPAARQCLEDLSSRHGQAPVTRALWAAVLAQTGQAAQAAALFERMLQEPGLGKEFQYQGRKWLGLMQAGAGNVQAAKQHLKAALELLPGVTNLDQSESYTYVAQDGTYQLGVGITARGELNHAVQVFASMWSLLPAPVDPAKMREYIKANP